jgi:hypothetical protein
MPEEVTATSRLTSRHCHLVRVSRRCPVGGPLVIAVGVERKADAHASRGLYIQIILIVGCISKPFYAYTGFLSQILN